MLKQSLTIANLLATLFIAGNLLVIIGCAQHPTMPPSELGDAAHLSIDNPIISRFHIELFAVDQKRVLDRDAVILSPGRHEVEFQYWIQPFDMGVRMLSFEALAGVSYQLALKDISEKWWPPLDQQKTTYYIRDLETNKIVSKGRDPDVDYAYFKSKRERKWYVDRYKGKIGYIPSNDGQATVKVPSSSTLWAKIGGAIEKNKSGGKCTVPAGQVVIELYNHRKYVHYYGRLVVDLLPDNTYKIEWKDPSFGLSDISKAWLTNTTTNERIGRFHSCWSHAVVKSFTDCEEAVYPTKVKYIDIAPGDPRFWWGYSGQDY